MCFESGAMSGPTRYTMPQHAPTSVTKITVNESNRFTLRFCSSRRRARPSALSAQAPERRSACHFKSSSTPKILSLSLRTLWDRFAASASCSAEGSIARRAAAARCAARPASVVTPDASSVTKRRPMTRAAAAGRASVRAAQRIIAQVPRREN
eukprot:Amastigsp_a341029_6.p2 type:complete len:153 gc:universal Amastigsp_a341029_6:505-47(-)